MKNKPISFISDSDDEEIILTTHEQDNICKVLQYYSIIGLIEIIIIVLVILLV